MIQRLFINFMLVMLMVGSTLTFADEQDALFANTWILHSLNQKKIDLKLYHNKKPSLTFDPANTYSAYAGCNQISGKFILDGTIKIQFAPDSAMTKMACSGPENIEDEFITTLQKVRYWTIKEHMLILQDKNKSNIMSFSQKLMR